MKVIQTYTEEEEDPMYFFQKDFKPIWEIPYIGKYISSKLELQ